MDRALDEHPMPDTLREQMRSVADHMRNRPDGWMEDPPDEA